MGLTLTAADAVLKEDYHGPIVEQLNNGNVLLAETETNTEDIVGRRFVTPLHMSRNSGVGARRERTTLPTAGSQGYKDIFGPVRSMYARIELSGQVIESMAKSRGAFIRALESEMDGAITDGKRDYCRQLWGESNGRLCGVNTVNSTTLTPSGIRDDQLRALEEGFLIDIGTLASPTSIATGRSVTAVDYTARTFTISGAAVNVTAGTHFVFRSGAGGASDNSGNPGDGQAELTGIQTMVDDTAILHTLDPASNPRWKSKVLTNPAGAGTDRAISENLVNQAIMQTEIASGQVVNLLVGSDGVYRSYANLLTGLKRNMDEFDLKGGYTAVRVGHAPQAGRQGKKLGLTWDRDCPNKRLYGLTTSDFNFMELLDWEWMDKAGAILVQVDNEDAYTGTLKAYKEYVLRRRNSQFVIKDVTES